jgi:hypothetical protein
MIHSQSPIRYAHDEKRDVLIPVERTRHVAYDHGAPCPRCNNGLCFPERPLDVHLERAEASW